MKPQPYDLIGDIHGYADHLETMLRHLGYTETGPTWRHPEGRQVIFLGDYVDRGPGIRRVLQIVRGMVEAGDALAIMGNHEYNAILYATPDGKGDFLRPHSKKNVKQHAETLAQFAGREEEWQDYLAWFATLPLWLELDGLRAVHATWDEAGIAAHPEWQAPGREWFITSAERGTETYRFADTLLKGIEIPLPKGYFFTDKEGIMRPEIRVRWWLPFEGNTYHAMALPESDTVPKIPIPEPVAFSGLGYPDDAPPTFFGHYWFPHDATPVPLAPNLASLDYSVAKPGGALTAYRWDGETTLQPEHFVQARLEIEGISLL